MDTLESVSVIYSRLANHPAVIKLVEMCGLCSDTCSIMEIVEKIDALIDSGSTYHDVFTSIIFCDSFPSNLALLVHAEAKFNTHIHSYVQLQKLTKIDIELIDEIKNSFYMALECRYKLALEKIIHDGGKYSDLLNTNPGDYGLPDKWEGIFKNTMTKEDIIFEALANYIEDVKMSDLDSPPPSLIEIADKIQAPYVEMLKASRYYTF